MNREKLLGLVAEIPDLRNDIQEFETEYYGTCSYFSDTHKLDKWRASLKYELRKLKENELVSEILTHLDYIKNARQEIEFDFVAANLEVLAENINDFAPLTTPILPQTAPEPHECATSQAISNKVFIVHGHDGQSKQQVARFLERLDLTAIILNEETNQSLTIIEKLEHHIESASFGIILYTKCDVGRAKNEAELTPRARQNVIFEHGYLYSRLC